MKGDRLVNSQIIYYTYNRDVKMVRRGPNTPFQYVKCSGTELSDAGGTLYTN